MSTDKPFSLPEYLIEKLSEEHSRFYLPKEGLLILDNNFVVTYWSNEMEVLSGIRKFEIQGEDLFNSKFRHILEPKEVFQEAMKNQSSLKFVHEQQERGLLFSITAFPVSDNFIVTVKDMTEEKGWLKELASVKKLKRHVLDSTPDLIWAVDTNFNLILGNTAYFDLTERNSGLPISLGENVLERSLKWDDDGSRQKMWMNLYSTALENNSVSKVFPIQDEDSEKEFEVVLQPMFTEELGEEKRIIGISCFAKDITQKLFHLRSINKQNDQLREIAWLQSHKVRAPLSNILGLTNIILDLDDPIEQKKFVELLSNSAQSLDSAIAEITQKTKN